MSNSPESYQKAYNELQELTQKLENNEVDIDQLSEVVSRAKELVKFCQNRLRTIEEDLNQED